MRDQEKVAKPPQLAQTGWCGQELFDHTTPSAPSEEASRLLLDVAATPPPAEEGSRRITTPEFLYVEFKAVLIGKGLYFPTANRMLSERINILPPDMAGDPSTRASSLLRARISGARPAESTIVSPFSEKK